MTAKRLDLECEQGVDFSFVHTHRDSAGNPVNLTGYKARMDIRRAYGDLRTDLVLTTENGRIALGGAQGTITLTIPGGDTAGIGVSVYPSWAGRGPPEAGMLSAPTRRQPDASEGQRPLLFVYDLEIVSAGSAITRVLHGRFVVSPEVTGRS